MGELGRGEQAAPDHLIGQTLASRYLVETRLGEGAMGTVYRAKHVKVGRAFAVKVLHARLLTDSKVVLRFEREAELAGRLRHPNVIGVVDIGEMPDGTRYMVMDFAAGPDLASLLVEAPMPPARIIHIVRQLLEGLFHAHENGLIHRDFKPENVIVERDSHGDEMPRIVDFGIAILREGGDSNSGTGRLTTNGLVLGTPHYMAPEQAVADPIDHRIDLFALGIMIYEMLSGKLPFDGTGAEVARANLLLEPPAINLRVPGLHVDPLLEAFARRLMAKSRDRRPATAKAARELLDLIERDRTAAAAALGAPASYARMQTPTELVPPRTRHTHDGPETYPPSFARDDVATPPMDSTPGQQRTPSPVRPPPAHVHDTELVPRRRMNRTGIAVGAIVAVLAIGGGVAVISGGKHEPPTPTPTPEPAPAPQPQVAIATPTPEVKPPVVDQVAPTPSDPKPLPTTAKPTTKPLGQHKIVPPAPVAIAPAPVAPEPVAPTPVAPPPVVAPTPKPAPVAAALPPVLDEKGFAARYQAVGQELKEYERTHGADATAAFWTRYRRISYAQAVSSQANRDSSAFALAQIHSDLATQK